MPMIRVIAIDDGYHEPSYFFENGFAILHCEDEFINMMCKPHTEDYHLYKIFIDWFEEDEEIYGFIESFERMTYEQIQKNFQKLYDIYLEI